MTRIMPRRLTHSHIIAASKLLELHCKKLPDGLAKYDQGWDDETVRVSIGIESLDGVKNLRRELIGPLFHKGKNGEGRRSQNGNGFDVEQRLKSAETNLGDHENDLYVMISNHNKAMEALANYFGHELNVDFRGLIVRRRTNV